MSESTTPNTEIAALSEAEQNALACRCHEALCPLHNEASDGHVEHEVTDLLATVERIIAARLAPLAVLADQWDARYGPFPNGFCSSLTIHEASGALRWNLRHPEQRISPGERNSDGGAA